MDPSRGQPASSQTYHADLSSPGAIIARIFPLTMLFARTISLVETFGGTISAILNLSTHFPSFRCFPYSLRKFNVKKWHQWNDLFLPGRKIQKVWQGPQRRVHRCAGRRWCRDPGSPPSSRSNRYASSGFVVVAKLDPRDYKRLFHTEVIDKAVDIRMVSDGALREVGPCSACCRYRARRIPLPPISLLGRGFQIELGH